MYKYENGLIVDVEDGQHIAEMCDGATPEQTVLLAAAPEMLETLKRIQRRFDNVPCIVTTDPDYYEYQDALKMAKIWVRDPIARAEGRL